MKRPAFFLILGAACLVVGLSSYRIGRDRALVASTVGGVQAAKEARATATTAVAVPSRPPAELASLKERLKHSYTTCPSAEHDWILRGQTAGLLDTMTTAELRTFLSEIASIPAGNRWSEWRVILARDLMRAWSRRDPVGACLATGFPLVVPAGRLGAFEDWLQRDPEAVARWMRSGDAVPVELRKAWLSEQVKADPYGAIQQLGSLAPEAREASLLEWSTSFALLPDERKALLDAVREDPAMLRKCAGRIADALADRSVEEAYAFVDNLDAGEETATALDDRIFVKWGMRDPQVAFAAWAEQKQTRLPENFLHALDNWSMNSPGAEQAIEWMDTVEAGPLKEKIQVHFIQQLTSGDRLDQAVEMALSIDNREEGQRQVLRVVETGKQKFPGHDKEWAAVLRKAGVEAK
jgi:hypothetical protein